MRYGAAGSREGTAASPGWTASKGDMWRDPLGTEASVPSGTRPWFLMVLEEVPMAIVGGLDLHRKQITFDVLDTVSGEVQCAGAGAVKSCAGACERCCSDARATRWADPRRSAAGTATGYRRGAGARRARDR